MKHSSLKEWYVVKWGKAVNSSTGAIDGIRSANAIMTAGDIVPRDWFDLVPAGSLDLIINQHDAFDAYELAEDDEFILYSLYPAKVPKGTFKERHNLPRTQWYRVTNECPTGIVALRTVSGICKAGDVAKAGDIIPNMWLSALSSDEIARLRDTGLRSVKWENEALTSEQKKMLNKRITKPLIVRHTPQSFEKEMLEAKYPGTRSDYKKPKPKTKTVKSED